MQSDDYTGFDGICLTDTFQLGEMDEDDIGKLFSDVFPYNSTRLLNQQNTPIRIILGNPPYSVGQTSANDNAQNESYPKLEKRLADTYVAGTKATNKNALYDSYIKAFRWASDRLDEEHGGIIGFVSNAGWLDGTAMDGMRSCLQEEFDCIYVFNLRGNQRTQGETSRREGGKIFGSGSRTPVAITILVKNPKQAKEKADIFYVDIGDYLSREDKLSIISDYKSCMNRKFSDAITVLKPNEYNDWLNQRNSEFENFIPIQANKKFDSTSKSIFVTYSMGLSTSRDSWVIGFSKDSIDNNAKIMIENYSNMLSKIKNITGDISDYIDTDAKKISWSSSLTNLFKRKKEIKYEEDTIRLHSYRPFTRNQIYWGEYLIHRRSLMDSLFPTKSHDNLIICCSVAGNNSEISVLITNIFADWHFNGDTQCFPLYYYEEAETQQGTLFDSNNGEKYIRHDGVTDFIFNQARKLYGNKVTKEDIFYYVYGFLHLPKYRTEFAADLKKSLPRVMLVKTPKVFWQISKAGRDLADIHLNYEHQTPPAEVVVEGADSGNFKVTKLKFQSKEDKSTLIYNKDIKITNIPEAAHSYVVNGRTPLEWIIDRYQVKVDKASGILNDPNKWGEEHNNPRYILDLILSCITVSIKTQEIVDSLPDVNFEE